MKISRDKQMALADIALRLLARAICAVSTFDRSVASDVAVLGDGFSFAICAGLDANAPAVRLAADNGRFARVRADASGRMDGDADTVRAQDLPAAQNGGAPPPTLTIRFKDVSGVIPVITGKKSVETAFAQHRMVISGNLNQAVALVRIISVTEAYLFPKPIIKKAMRRIPKKQVPSLFVYIALPFFGIRKPSRIIETNLDGPSEAVGEPVAEPDTEIKDELEAVK